MTMVTATICGTALWYLASSWLNGKNFTKLVEWPVVDSVPWHSNVGLGTKKPVLHFAIKHVGVSEYREA